MLKPTRLKPVLPVRVLRRSQALAFAVALSLHLAACGPGGSLSPALPDLSPANPTTPVDAQALPDLNGAGGPGQSGVSTNPNQIGTGPVKVGLILPLTTPGGTPSVVGQAMRNAADLAIAESGTNELTLLVKDDQSAPAGAQAATQAALGEGAELIIGPLFSPNVREAGRLAHNANRPVIAFSTDSNTASRGVYLLSFLVESYVNRVVDFAASKGKKSVAALIPDNEYGAVAEAALQQAAARDGLRVQQIEHYKPAGAGAAVQKIVPNLAQIDTLFVAEGPEATPALMAQVQTAGLLKTKVQILGTGLWNDARVLRVPSLQGAWFAGPENDGFSAFAQRYRAKYGSDPTRVSSLAYDAVSLAAALAHSQGAQRFSDTVLANPSGFNGLDGVFRFRPDGTNERALTVFEIGNGTTSAVSPAPKSFAGGT